MNIEEELVVLVRISFAEFALNSAVARTYVSLEHVGDDVLDVLDFSKLYRRPVV